ncbi:hypothetical protein D3C76_1379530 [compost metagenome]
MINPLCSSNTYHSSPRSAVPSLLFQWVHSITASLLSWLTRIFSMVHCDPRFSTHHTHLRAMVSAVRHGISGSPDGK